MFCKCALLNRTKYTHRFYQFSYQYNCAMFSALQFIFCLKSIFPTIHLLASKGNVLTEFSLCV